MTANRRSMVFGVFATAVVVAALIAAMFVLGPPSAQRRRKMDEVRVQDLSSLEMTVNGYFKLHGALPAGLDVLAKEPGYRVARQDPDTGKPYEYQILSADSYRLCADFAVDPSTEPYNSFGGYTDVAWAHGRGHRCFDRKTDKIK